MLNIGFENNGTIGTHEERSQCHFESAFSCTEEGRAKFAPSLPHPFVIVGVDMDANMLRSFYRLHLSDLRSLNFICKKIVHASNPSISAG